MSIHLLSSMTVHTQKMLESNVKVCKTFQSVCVKKDSTEVLQHVTFIYNLKQGHCIYLCTWGHSAQHQTHWSVSAPSTSVAIDLRWIQWDYGCDYTMHYPCTHTCGLFSSIGVYYVSNTCYQGLPYSTCWLT